MAVAARAQEAEDAWQEIRFEDKVINQIVVDGSALWIGASDGLYRFDGRDPQKWDVDEVKDIRSLLMDRQNRLWIGTNRGLLVLDAERPWSEPVAPLPELVEPVWTMENAVDGGVWVGSDRGLYHVARAGAATSSSEPESPIRLAEEAVQALAQAPSGDLWIGTRDNGLFLLEQMSDPEPQITAVAAKNPRINALLLGEDGKLWVGTEGGLCIVSSGDLHAGCHPQFSEFEDQAITGLFQDPLSPGASWIATADQLWHYAPPAKPAPEESLAIDVRTMAGDGEGQLWAGSTDGLWRRRTPLWRPLLANLDPDKQDILTILEDHEGTLWAGTEGGLIRQESEGRWRTVEALDSMPIACLYASEYDGSIWACLDRQKGVAQIALDAAGEPQNVERFLTDKTINDIWQYGEGTLLFAAGDGVWQKTGSEWTHYFAADDAADGLPNPVVNALMGDGRGSVWAGTNGGLSYFDGSSWGSPACPVPRDLINDLAWDGARGQLWIATREGLALCDGEDYEIPQFEGSLIDDNVRTVVLEGVQEEGNAPSFLLAGTFEGLSRINIRDPRLMKLPVASFSTDTDPDLKDNRVQALHVDGNGRLLLGSSSGLYVYQPSDQPPGLQYGHPNCSGPGSSCTFGEPLTIGYNDESQLKVSGLDLRTDLDDLVFRFEIDDGDGVSQAWSASGELDLTLDLLGADEHMTVTSWAYDRDFNQSSAPAILEIIREADPLEQQTWFQVLMITLPVATIALAWWLIRWQQFEPYQNLEVKLYRIPEKKDYYQVQVRGGRWLHKLPNWLQIGNSRLFFDLGPEERPRHRDSIESGMVQIRKLDEMTDIYERLGLLQEVGSKLYTSLFSDETAALLREKFGLGDKNRPLRLRLVVESNLEDADALPWELLYGGDELGFLTIDSNVALVRDYPISKAKPNKVKSDLKVLLLISSPRDLPLKKETIEKEINAIESFTSKDNRRVIHHASQEDLQDLAAGGYDVIHFLGHGNWDGEQGILYFEDDGDAHPIYQDILVENFSNARPTLIFLNACRSAKSGDSDNAVGFDIILTDSQKGSSSLAAVLVAEANVPAVVGMGYEIDSESANDFSRAFYQKLILLGQVDDAVKHGREILSTRNTTYPLASVASRDWFTPRLYVGLMDTAIYKQSLRRQHRLVQAIRGKFTDDGNNSEE